MRLLLGGRKRQDERKWLTGSIPPRIAHIPQYVLAYVDEWDGTHAHAEGGDIEGQMLKCEKEKKK